MYQNLGHCVNKLLKTVFGAGASRSRDFLGGAVAEEKKLEPGKNGSATQHGILEVTAIRILLV